MDKIVFISCGISGSGKSTFFNGKFPKEVIVNPDLIRKELTGDISIQEKNKEVWEKVFSDAKEIIETKRLVVLDAMNMKAGEIKAFIKHLEPTKVNFIIFTPELELSIDRVKKDIEQGKERSNVPEEAIKKQFNRFLNNINNVLALDGTKIFIDSKTGLEIDEAQFKGLLKGLKLLNLDVPKSVNESVKDFLSNLFKSKENEPEQKPGETPKEEPLNQVNAKGIFVPRNIEGRKEDLKEPWIKKGYTSKQVYIGNIYKAEKLKNLKVVVGTVHLNDALLTKFDFDLDEVTKDFDVEDTSISSLVGAPKKVGGFLCRYNENLKSLEGFPQQAWHVTFSKNGARFSVEEIKAVCKCPRILNDDYFDSMNNKKNRSSGGKSWGGMDEADAKDIFVPRNPERHEDKIRSIKAEWVKKGYKEEEILYSEGGLSISDVEKLKGIKVVLGGVMITKNSLTNFPFDLDEVTGWFLVGECPNLISLQGSPKIVGRECSIHDCEKLSSLDGATKKAWKFMFYNNGKRFSDDQLKEVCDAKMYVNDEIIDYSKNAFKKSPKRKINEIEGKDIFVPRNADRFEDLKDEWIKRGYKSEQIYVGDLFENDHIEKLKGIKIVIGNVHIHLDNITTLPCDLDEVSGTLSVTNNKLTTLKGCPKYVGDNFYCSDNELTSLEYAPKVVGGNFYCSHNPGKFTREQVREICDVQGEVMVNSYMNENVNAKNIFVPRNLERRREDIVKPYLDKGYKIEQIYVGDVYDDFDMPNVKAPIKVVIGNVYISGQNYKELPCDLDWVTGDFDCNNNYLTTLIGAPKIVGGTFNCKLNELTSLEFAPKEVGDFFQCSYNPGKFKDEDVKKVCKVRGKIITTGTAMFETLSGFKEGVEAKDIFVPRNMDRFEDLKKPYIDKGYLNTQVYCGVVDTRNLNKLKGIKVVIGDVLIENSTISEFSFRLDEVTGDFNVIESDVISLKGSPKKVGGDFNCYANLLGSLKDAPKEVVGNFLCFNNEGMTNGTLPVEEIRKISNVKGKIITTYEGLLDHMEMNETKIGGVAYTVPAKVDRNAHPFGMPFVKPNSKAELKRATKGDKDKNKRMGVKGYSLIEEDLKGKDIFVPRNMESRKDDLIKPYLAKGYKPEQILVGNVTYASELYKLKGIKVVIGEVILFEENLQKFDFDLDEVTTDFYCHNNELTSLKGSPKKVGGNFVAFGNKLTTLVGGPEYVGETFYCEHNKLTSTEGFPKYVGDTVFCGSNPAKFTEEQIRAVCDVKGQVKGTELFKHESALLKKADKLMTEQTFRNDILKSVGLLTERIETDRKHDEIIIDENLIGLDHNLCKQFIKFTKEYLKIKTPLKVVFSSNRDNFTTFAYYNVGKGDAAVYCVGRNVLDVFRSISHELTHGLQDEEDRINDENSKSENDGVNIENEANSKAGEILRKFGRLHKELYTSEPITIKK